MRLKYAEFLCDLRDRKGWTNQMIADRIMSQTGVVVRKSQVDDYLRGKSEPRAGFARAVEVALGVNLLPSDYGFGSLTKPGEAA